jgi:hypothetical protein
MKKMACEACGSKDDLASATTHAIPKVVARELDLPQFPELCKACRDNWGSVRWTMVQDAGRKAEKSRTEKQYRCPYCEERLATIGGVWDHLARTHEIQINLEIVLGWRNAMLKGEQPPGEEFAGPYIGDAAEALEGDFPATITQKYKKCDKCPFAECDLRDEGAKLEQTCTVEITQDLVDTECGESELCDQCPNPGEGCPQVTNVGFKRLTENPFELPAGKVRCPVCNRVYTERGLPRHLSNKHPEYEAGEQEPEPEPEPEPASQKHERIPDDAYYTPREFIELLARYEDLSGANFLEPAAGDGRMLEFVKCDFAQLIEIRAEAIPDLENLADAAYRETKSHKMAIYGEDFLAWDPDHQKKFDIILTNPPFSLCLEFARKCLKHLNPGGRCIMLLRQNFLASDTRYKFNKVAPLKHVIFLSNRPRFVNNGTDRYDYAWFVWQEGFTGPATIDVAHLKELEDETQTTLPMPSETKNLEPKPNRKKKNLARAIFEKLKAIDKRLASMEGS